MIMAGLEVAAMGVIVTARSGYDLGYAWKIQGQGGGKPAAKTPDGYYIAQSRRRHAADRACLVAEHVAADPADPWLGFSRSRRREHRRSVRAADQPAHDAHPALGRDPSCLVGDRREVQREGREGPFA